MTIKSRRLSIVLSPASATPSPEKSVLKRYSLAGSRPRSIPNSAACQSNPQDQVLVDQLKVEVPHQIHQLRKHLNLLDSFNVLINLSKQTIRAFNSSANPNHALNTQDNSKINNRQDLDDSFYHLILFRFELWLGRIADHLPKSLFEFNSNEQRDFVNLNNREDDYEIELTLDYLPPLDVLFVWYCYCLNSRNYYEDSLRLYPILKHLRFPLDLATSEYDCSCPCTNYEKLKSKMKLENLAEADALLKAIKTSSSSESIVDYSPVHEDLKNPSLLSTLLLPKSFNTKAGSNSKNLWDNLTNTNFNIIDFINHPSLRTFICPICSDTIESPFYLRDPDTKLVHVSDSCWPYSSDPRSVSPDSKPEYEKTQQETLIDMKPVISTHKNHAKLKCYSCKWVGTKQDLSLFKFATELKFCLSNLSYTNNIDNHSESTPVDCLAGTLTTSENLNDVKNAIFFNNLLLRDQNDAIFKHFDKQNPSDINVDCLNYLEKVQNSIKFNILNNNSIPFSERNQIEKSFNNLLKSYCVPEPFTVDLIRSMKIQRLFVKRMVQLGWTEISSPKKKLANITQEEIDYRFQSCISRYKAFSSLVLTTQPHLILIPTSDIDLAWKTDRLRGVRYTESMMRTNKIMIDHPDEFDFDKSKFFDQFRLTSALWIHRYQIEYSRYPAPFVKCDRRQNSLKKALAHIIPTPQSSLKAKLHNEVDSSEGNDHAKLKLTQSQIRKTSSAVIHSKLDSHQVAHNPKSSTRVIDHPVQKKPSDLNHKISIPIKPVQAWTDMEENQGILSPVESLMELQKTPDVLLLEHKAAQISVASYFENIYTTNYSSVKSGTISLQRTPSKQRNQNLRTQLDNKEGKHQPLKGKQVAEDILKSGSSSVDTLYPPSSCLPSKPALENEIVASSNAEVPQSDAGVIYEARKISIKLSDDRNNLQNPISKVFSVIEPYNVKKHGFNALITSNPLPQTTTSPIRLFPLNSSVSQNQTDQGMIIRPLTSGAVKNKPQLDGNGTQNLAQKSDKNQNWLNSIQDPAGSDLINHQYKQRIEDHAKNSTTCYLSPKDDSLNHKEEQHQSKNVDATQNPLDDEKNKKPSRDTVPTVESENYKKSRIANSNIPILLVTPERNNNSSATVSKPSHPLYNLDSSSPNHSFFEIPIGKIAFVEEGNKLRCL